MQDWVAVSEIIRNLAIVVGGALGIYLAWKRVTAANRQAEAQTKQAELQRRVFVDELFNRAVGQLKDEKLEVRLGAIFTLRQICDDYPDLSRPILETLAAYIRENRSRYGDDLPPADIREVINILRDRLGRNGMNEHARQPGASGFSLDLHGAFIRRTDLSHANLQGANLSGADCSRAIFRGANLKNTNLTGTVLRGADLSDVKNLTVEQLRDAIIDEATILPDYIDRARLDAA